MTAWILAGLAATLCVVLAARLRKTQARLRHAEQQYARDKQELETSLQRAHDLREGILKAVADPLVVLNSGRRILFANPAAESLLGQDVAGETLMAAIPHPELETLIQDANKTHSEAVERRIEYEKRILHARAVASEQADYPFEVLTLSDVTQIQRLERARREMVSNLTHELSTPITTIGLLAETLQNVAQTEKPKRLRKMAKDIRREAEHLTHLVQEVRDLSLIESGQMPVRLLPTDLRSMVWSAVDQLQAMAESKSQLIQLDIEAGISVLAEERQIQRAIKNILHNAIKFSPERGLIRITATLSGNEAILAVKDNGLGIPADDLPRVFERFYQVDRARRDGTGLGLAIVRHIVLAHGGRTWAESVEGQGATFFIALPLSDAEPASPPDDPVTASVHTMVESPEQTEPSAIEAGSETRMVAETPDSDESDWFEDDDNDVEDEEI